MLIKIDTRESSLLQQINTQISFIPVFKTIEVKSETLPIGDIIINDGKEDRLIIERKSVNDLLASIKDGRYEEQSYRLNGLNHHNHNIIYLIEGDVNRVNRFKADNKIEKLTLYSAMFSLNYYKGFSLFRSFSLEETANIICNMAYKMEKDALTKTPYYQNKQIIFNTNQSEQQTKVDKTELDKCEPNENKEEQEPEQEIEQSQEINGVSEKDYVSVVKKIKKENITPDNIGEIMLCQIPGISSVTALAVMDKFKTIPNLIKEIETNNDCLKDLSYTNAKGQVRKINKTCILNIAKFLLKK
jgi:ERCC4-type nuclease